MACLLKLLGLSNVTHPNSIYKCPWCKVTADEIGLICSKWPMRKLKDHIQIANELKSHHYAVSTLRKKARENGGIKYSPIFNFEFDHVVPDILHALMRTTHLFVKKLIQPATNNNMLTKKLEDAFEKLKI